MRVDGREGSGGERFARRKGWGESLAKVVRGKVREAAILGGGLGWLASGEGY